MELLVTVLIGMASLFGIQYMDDQQVQCVEYFTELDTTLMAGEWNRMNYNAEPNNYFMYSWYKKTGPETVGIKFVVFVNPEFEKRTNSPAQHGFNTLGQCAMEDGTEYNYYDKMMEVQAEKESEDKFTESE